MNDVFIVIKTLMSIIKALIFIKKIIGTGFSG